MLFEWHSLDHVGIADSWSPILTPFDYFHINSIDVDLDGNLLVSARNTWGVYKLDRKTGAVIWRLGSKSSDFELGPGVQFMYQHDARAHPDGTITLYDDGPGNASHQSRAIRIGLSMADRRAVLLQEFLHPNPITAVRDGERAVPLERERRRRLGHSTVRDRVRPARRRAVRRDVRRRRVELPRLPQHVDRATPAHPPSIAVKRRGTGATVYASFNGSTETAYWSVLGGAARNALRPLTVAKRNGFETVISLRNAPAHIAVKALDVHRRPIATSRVV